MKPPRVHRCALLLAVATFGLPGASLGQSGYVKHGPNPPDANKVGPMTDDTCWLATAANMLAGAGYGQASTEQQRAEEIYQQLKIHFVGQT